MKIVILLILLSFLSPALFSQKILLDKDVSKAYKILHGPNSSSFKQFFFGTGIIPAENNNSGAEINTWKSGYLIVGFRQKFKVMSFYSLGYEIEYSNLRYNLKQNEDKTFPDVTLHDNERLKFNSLGISAFNRVNIGKRGNIIGKFIDVGAYANWVYRTVHSAKDDDYDAENMSDVRVVKNIGLKYISNYQYGLIARAGINWIALKGTYRLSDLFKTKYDLPELPRFQIGFEITLPN